MKRTDLESAEYINSEEAGFYLCIKEKGKVSDLLAEGIAKCSPNNDSLFLRSDLDNYLRTGNYLNGKQQSPKELSELRAKAEADRIKTLEMAKADYQKAREELGEDLNINDTKQAHALRRAQLIN